MRKTTPEVAAIRPIILRKVSISCRNSRAKTIVKTVEQIAINERFKVGDVAAAM